ncbi:unnamed protein product, partial [Gadus morhua 'NCC']
MKSVRPRPWSRCDAATPAAAELGVRQGAATHRRALSDRPSGVSAGGGGHGGGRRPEEHVPLGGGHSAS